MEEEGDFGAVPHVLEQSADGGLVHHGGVSQLSGPGRLAVDNKFGQVGCWVLALGLEPDVLGTGDLRVGRGGALGALAQVEDLLDVAGQLLDGLRVLGGEVEGAAAVDEARGQGAPGDGAHVADVD